MNVPSEPFFNNIKARINCISVQLCLCLLVLDLYAYLDRKLTTNNNLFVNQRRTEKPWSKKCYNSPQNPARKQQIEQHEFH